MASIVTSRHTLGTAAAQVTAIHHEGNVVTFHNAAKSSNNRIFLGGSAVGTATGIHIDADQFLTLTLGPTQVLYAMSDPAGIVLEVLEQRM